MKFFGMFVLLSLFMPGFISLNAAHDAALFQTAAAQAYALEQNSIDDSCKQKLMHEYAELFTLIAQAEEHSLNWFKTAPSCITVAKDFNTIFGVSKLMPNQLRQVRELRRLKRELRQIQPELWFLSQKFPCSHEVFTKINNLAKLHDLFIEEIVLTKKERVLDALLYRPTEFCFEHKKKIIIGVLAALGAYKLLYRNKKGDILQSQNNVTQDQVGQARSGQSRDDIAAPQFVLGTPFKYTNLSFKSERPVEITFTPYRDSYKQSSCPVPAQRDGFSCGHRALTTAAYLIQAIEEGRDIRSSFLRSKEDLAAFNKTLQEVLAVTPNEWTGVSHFDKILNPQEGHRSSVPFINQTIRNRTKSDFVYLNTSSAGYTGHGKAVKYSIDKLLLYGQTHDTANGYGARDCFLQGLPIVAVVLIENHWITIVVQLATDAQGKNYPEVITFDGFGSQHKNCKEIDLFLYELTRGTPYQTGTLQTTLTDHPLERQARHQLDDDERYEFNQLKRMEVEARSKLLTNQLEKIQKTQNEQLQRELDRINTELQKKQEAETVARTQRFDLEGEAARKRFDLEKEERAAYWEIEQKILDAQIAYLEGENTRGKTPVMNP